MLGLKRSWKLTAAARLPLAAASQDARASSRSSPIGFWISTAAPAGRRCEDAEDLIAGHGDVEHRAADGATASPSDAKTVAIAELPRPWRCAASRRMSNMPATG